ncbi:MAG: hypothetical protein AAFM92_03245 [Pseudomonadota bacterium]
MPDVYAWPPVHTTAYEHTISRPVQRSEGLSGSPRLSQSEATRTLITAVVTGIGPDRLGAGYVEMLKRLLDGKLALVRLNPLPQHWYPVTDGLDGLRGTPGVEWTDGGAETTWEEPPAVVFWTFGNTIEATAGADTWPYVDCSGLPANRLIAAPSEPVRVGTITAYALRPSYSNAQGEARIYVSSALPSGPIIIGSNQSRVFEIDSFPRAVQPASENYSYNFTMTERFESDFTSAFTELNPWT